MQRPGGAYTRGIDALGHEECRPKSFGTSRLWSTAGASIIGREQQLAHPVHWADAANCNLLVHLASHLSAAAVLSVRPYCDSDANENAALIRAPAELNRRLLLTLRLPPLDSEESYTLAAHLLQAPVAPAVADLVQEHAEGNPFFLGELLRVLVEEGSLVLQVDRWRLQAQPANLRPPQVAAAIQMRLERLDPTAVELLRVAAVIGRAFEPILLAALTGLEDEHVEAQLQLALRAQIIWLKANGFYTMSHNMVREMLAASIGSVRRRGGHCPPSHYSARRGRYCNASARCAGPMVTLPARSAIVRASLRTRW